MRLVLATLGLLVVASCSSSVPKAYLPVDSPLHAWSPPEQDETAPAPAPAPPPPAKKPSKK